MNTLISSNAKNTIVKPAIAIDTPDDTELSKTGPLPVVIGPSAIIDKIIHKTDASV